MNTSALFTFPVVGAVGYPPVATETSYRYQRISTSDSEHHAACLSEWEQTYSQLEGGQFNGELIDIGFSEVQVFRESTNRSVFQNGSPKADCVVIGTAVAMEGSALFSGKQFGSEDLIAFNAAQRRSARFEESWPRSINTRNCGALGLLPPAPLFH